MGNGLRERKGSKREKGAAARENMGKKKCEHGRERSRCKD